VRFLEADFLSARPPAAAGKGRDDVS
jgi:hypothetical protein